MAVEKGTKLHTKKSIKKMLATRRRNKALKDSIAKQDAIARQRAEAASQRKPPIHINLPGVRSAIAAEARHYRTATPAENIESLYARLSQHFAPAERREIEEAIRLLKLFDFILEVAGKKIGG